MMEETYIFSKQVVFPSERKAVKLFEPLIAELRDMVSFSDELYYNILIAGTEAVNNAIIHGNKCIKNKKVVLIVRANDRAITVEIRDEGEGFETDEVGDPRNPDNLMKVSGRGVFLIKELADGVEFKRTETGMHIKMIFRLK